MKEVVDDIYKYEEWETATNALEIWIEDWFFVLAMALFAIEFMVLVLEADPSSGCWATLWRVFQRSLHTC